ncbi:MAG: phage replisome organizer N-terminal domain-containing protein [Deltaproteobacteria bacterium]|nr:phage replisome organizer N-terminal domain-containing protein [Deltaproteobacteria bacterium]
MQWIKLMCNILDHRKIKIIRLGPDGNTLVLLWLMMLTEAGKCNRGGYLMVSDNLPYTADTLSVVTGIPPEVVQTGLTTFLQFKMIDMLDGKSIYIKNWSKYQSQDQLMARREKDRARQQRHRQNERDKICTPPTSNRMSRDSDVTVSRDITLQNRQEKNREEKTTEQVRLLFAGTPFLKISDQELEFLMKRHGLDRLLEAADVAAETWRRNPDEKNNLGGYLNSLCTSLLTPCWYLPYADRREVADASRQRKVAREIEEAAIKVKEEEQIAARSALWESLTEEQRTEYRTVARAGMPKDIAPSVAVTAIAKTLAWKAIAPKIEVDDQRIHSPHPVAA